MKRVSKVEASVSCYPESFETLSGTDWIGCKMGFSADLRHSDVKKILFPFPVTEKLFLGN
jgi:hypothetical protein